MPSAAQRTPPRTQDPHIWLLCARAARARTAQTRHPTAVHRGHRQAAESACRERKPRASRERAGVQLSPARPRTAHATWLAWRAQGLRGGCAVTCGRPSACISKRGNSCPPARPTWRPDRKWRHRAHLAHVARCLPHAGSPQSPGSPASSSVRHATGKAWRPSTIGIGFHGGGGGRGACESARS